MKERIARELVRKSSVNTSEDFTDKLLLKIEAEKASPSLTNWPGIPSFRYAVLTIAGTGIVSLILLYSGLLPKFTLLDFELQINKTPFLVVLLLLLLTGINHLLKLQHLTTNLKKD
ncbi:hypothetical protein [Sinomicrobium sp. M5D2P9]